VEIMACEVTMEWTCARCGQLAEMESWAALTDDGWTLNEVGDGICVSCTVRQWPAARRSLPPHLASADSPQAGRSPGLAAHRRNAATIAVPSASRVPPARPRPHLALVK
jgi:hypothetical protein